MFSPFLSKKEGVCIYKIKIKILSYLLSRVTKEFKSDELIEVSQVQLFEKKEEPLEKKNESFQLNLQEKENKLANAPDNLKIEWEASRSRTKLPLQPHTSPRKTNTLKISEENNTSLPSFMPSRSSSIPSTSYIARIDEPAALQQNLNSELESKRNSNQKSLKVFKKMKREERKTKIEKIVQKEKKNRVQKLIEKAFDAFDMEKLGQMSSQHTLETSLNECRVDSSLLIELYSEISALESHNKLVSSVPPKDLVQLVTTTLYNQIKKADCVDIFKGKHLNTKLNKFLSGQKQDNKQQQNEKCANKENATNCSSIEMKVNSEQKPESNEQIEDTVTLIYNCLESIKIVLVVMISKDVPKKVFNEEMIEDLLRILEFHISHSLFPFFDEDLRDPSEKKAKKVNCVSEEMKKILAQVYEIFDKFHSFIQICKLPSDSAVFKLCNICISCFFVEGVQALQPKALNVLREIFARYSTHRDYILGDIFSSLSKLSSNKKCTKKYKLSSKVSVQMISVVILQLLQSCTFPFESNSLFSSFDKQFPQQTSIDNTLLSSNIDNTLLSSNAVNTLLSEKLAPGKEKREGEEEEEEENRGVWDAINCTQAFLLSFCEKCCDKSKGTEYRKLLDNFVGDLLLMMNKPEFPASVFFLHLLTRCLIDNFASPSKNSKIPESMRSFSVELLGKIGASLKCEQKLIQNSIRFLSSSLSLPSLPSLPPPSIRGECACGIDLPTESKIVCIKCSLSFHSKCVGMENSAKFNNSGTRSKSQKKNQVSSNQQLFLSESWVCDFCLINSEAEKMQEKEEKGDKVEEISKSLLPTVSLTAQLPTNHTLPFLEENDFLSPLKTNTNSTLGERREANPKVTFHLLQTQLLLFLNSLLQSGKDVSCLHTIFFYIAQWKAERQIEKQEALQLESILSSSPPSPSSSSLLTKKVPSKIIVEHIVRLLSSKHSFYSCFGNILKTIVLSLNGNSKSWRAKTMKALSLIAEQDPSALKDSSVEMAVTKRLLDTSISVRSASVELLGKFIFKQFSLLPIYFPHLLGRLLDTGLSVRKQVVKTFARICVKKREGVIVEDILQHLLARLKEEKSVKKIILKTFELLWFSSLDSNRKLEEWEQVEEGEDQDQQLEQQEDKNEKSASLFLSSKEEDPLDIARRTRQIVNIIASFPNLPTSSAQPPQQAQQREQQQREQQQREAQMEGRQKLFMKLVKRMRNEEKVGIKQKKMTNTILSKLVGNIVEQILLLHEMKSKKEHTGNHTSQGVKTHQLRNNLLSHLRALIVFSKIDASLVVPFIQTIQPYLSLYHQSSTQSPSRNVGETKEGQVKEEKRDEQVMLLVLDLLQIVLPHLEEPETVTLRTLEKDLYCLIEGTNREVVSKAIECFCCIAKKVENCNSKLLYELFDKYFKQLLSLQKQDIKNPRNQGFVARAILKTTLICRFFDFQAFFSKLTHLPSLSTTSPSNSFSSTSLSSTPTPSTPTPSTPSSLSLSIKSSVYELCKHFFGKSEGVLKGMCVDALGNIFLSHPPFLSSSLPLWKASLSPNTNTLIKSKFLNHLTLLLLEEERLSSLRKESLPSSTSSTATTGRGEEREEEGEEGEEERGRVKESTISLKGVGVAIGEVVAKNRKELVECLQDKSSVVRTAGLACVERLVLGGVMNPLDCCSSLISLLADSSPSLRASSFKTLRYIHSKHSNFILSSFKEGLLASHKIHLLSSPPPLPSPPLSSNASGSGGGSATLVEGGGGGGGGGEEKGGFFGKLYSLFGNNKVARQSLLSNFLDLLLHHKYEQHSQLSFASFLATNICLLPFSSTEEPLFLIYHLNRSSSLLSSSLLSLLKLQKDSLSNSTSTVSNSTSTALMNGEEKLNVLKASALLTSVLLKNTLKKQFKLSNNKCKEYSPSSPSFSFSPLDASSWKKEFFSTKSFLRRKESFGFSSIILIFIFIILFFFPFWLVLFILHYFNFFPKMSLWNCSFGGLSSPL